MCWGLWNANYIGRQETSYITSNNEKSLLQEGFKYPPGSGTNQSSMAGLPKAQTIHQAGQGESTSDWKMVGLG